MPRIAIIGTGGTIQNTDAGRLSLETVLADIRAHGSRPLPADVELETTELLSGGAETFGPSEWLTIATAVDAAARRDNVDGVVLTHGTFTAEETAYVLHLVIRSAKPIVLAVSQRKHDAIGNDGDRNLVDAIRVAGAPQSAGMGVLLVVSDEIHSARDVTKEHRHLAGFRSNHGTLGGIESDQVTFYRRPLRRHTVTSALDLAALAEMPRVDIVTAYPGADGSAIEAFIAAGAQGLVTSGYAYSGVATPTQMELLRAAAEGGLAVVLASRGREGRIPDAGRDWGVRGDNLTPQKARILLGLGLTLTRRRTELQELFDTH
ncbi:MAG: asparaginase [Candidatus Limnocylindria bacterium]